MGALLAVVSLLGGVNAFLLRIGRAIGVVAVAFMVVAILVQVFFRYVLNNALPWPDEASRFCMLWSAGLIAPTAMRASGFVAIDMVSHLLPTKLAQLLQILLLSLSLLVLVVAFRIGWSEVTGFGGKFATTSLYIPTSFDFSQWMRVPRSWMMSSLLVGIGLLVLVNVELVLRSIVQMLGGKDRLPVIEGEEMAGAE